MTADATSAPVVKPIAELFRHDVVAFWATTYNVDLALFNQYLLRRLGDPPLNAVVLADRAYLDGALERVPTERADTLDAVNRRWLLRGVRLGSGRFHPKSYLAATPRTVKLLVGSGNLSASGIDGGREVFTVFTGGTPRGDAAIANWVTWMRRLVGAAGDTVLAERFADLERRVRMTERVVAVAESPLWHNLDTPLGTQFADAVLDEAEKIDELIVTAPFYDEGAEALGQLVRRLRPRRVRVYTDSSTSVDGRRLVARLAAADADIASYAYLPDRFTHAKLIAAVAGPRAWLLSGSANLSHAALTLTAGHGNVELAAFGALPAEVAINVFLPPDVTAERRPLTALADLKFRSNDDVPLPTRVRITRATLLPGGRVEVTTDPPPDATWRLADHIAAQPLIAASLANTAATSGPLGGPLVYVVDNDGSAISNRAVVDDLDALHRSLDVDERTGSGRPPELTMSDLETPLGRALLFLHQHAIMDVAERIGTGTAGDGASRDEAAGDATDESLWDRLEREKLGRDPRASLHARLFGDRPVGTGELAEPLLDLLEAMRDRAPAVVESGGRRERSLLRTIAQRRTGQRWTPSARMRVRARNVLRRWAAAQTDPRLMWVDALAPLGNLVLVATVLAEVWCANAESDGVVEFGPNDLNDAWARWFQPFVGTGQGDGWLDRVDTTQDRLRRHLTGDFTHLATALTWLGLRGGGRRRERDIAWQPYLRAALDNDLIDVGDDTVEYLAATGHAVTGDRVNDDLLDVLTFIDDDLWCQHRVIELGLDDLQLEPTHTGQDASVRLRVSGIEHPLYDPRLAQLITAARWYRNTDGVSVFAKTATAGHDWRIVVTAGDSMTFRAHLDAPDVETNPVRATTLDELVASHGVLADLFSGDELVA